MPPIPSPPSPLFIFSCLSPVPLGTHARHQEIFRPFATLPQHGQRPQQPDHIATPTRQADGAPISFPVPFCHPSPPISIEDLGDCGSKQPGCDPWCVGVKCCPAEACCLFLQAGSCFPAAASFTSLVDSRRFVFLAPAADRSTSSYSNIRKVFDKITTRTPNFSFSSIGVRDPPSFCQATILPSLAMPHRSPSSNAVAHPTRLLPDVPYFGYFVYFSINSKTIPSAS